MEMVYQFVSQAWGLVPLEHVNSPPTPIKPQVLEEWPITDRCIMPHYPQPGARMGFEWLKHLHQLPLC